MSKFASNKNAYGICDITGFRYKLKEMKMTWDGKLVGPDQYDAKHPQLDRRPIALDAQAIKNARPDTSDDNNFFSVYTNVDKGKLGSPAVSFGVQSGLGNIQINEPVVDTVSQTLSSLSVTGTLGTISLTGVDTSQSQSVTGLGITSSLSNVQITSAFTTIAVTVVGGNPSNHPYYNVGSANKFAINGSTATADVTLNLNEGETYRFDQSDSSNSGHPLRFSTTANGTHGGGTEYTTGVTTNGTAGSAGAYTQITVPIGAPTLYYYCTNHSGMGWQANTPYSP